MRPKLSLLVLACLAGPLAAQAVDLWPNQRGNRWRFDDGREIRIDHRHGGWAWVEGLAGDRWWWFSTVSGRAWVWNRRARNYSLALDLDAGRFASAVEDGGCLDGSTWRVVDRDATVDVPVGRFPGCLVLALESNPCADAGLTRIVFAPGVGPIVLEETTIAGPLVARLERATVDGVDHLPRPGQASRTARIPDRPAGAPTGSAWVAAHRHLGLQAREQPIVDAITGGNLPEHLRNLREVTLESAGHTLTFWVLPDYLAIGTDDDFVRIPVGLEPARRIADAFGFHLPTAPMVDAIWRSATVRLAPRPRPPGPAMTSLDEMAAHDRTIDGQLAGRPPGDLVAGHKKDVVESRRLATRPDRIAIYGWHLASGKPIQPLSTVHVHWYADYSHGIRLVHRRVVVDGVERDLAEVLADPLLAGVFE